MEILRSPYRCSRCKSLVSLKHPDAIVATIKLDRKTNQDHYYCDEHCFRMAMGEASHRVELNIIKIEKTAPGHYDVICHEIDVEYTGDYRG